MNSRPLAPFLISLALLGFVADGALRAQTPAPAASGADAVRSALLASVARDLTAHFNVEGDLQLESLRPWGLPGVPASGEIADPAAWSAAVLDVPQMLASSLLLRVRVSGPGGASRDETLTVRAQLWRDAWVARAPFERGVSFDPAGCDLRRIDAFRERDTLSTQITRTHEWTFVRPVPAGRLVTWRDLARRALVRKGEVIEVSAAEGSLQITLKALAMQDGGQGETVRVRNLDSKREFAALVVAESRAQVRF
jgi:flagellar basal body P-ring formation protein FlgA